MDNPSLWTTATGTPDLWPETPDLWLGTPDLWPGTPDLLCPGLWSGHQATTNAAPGRGAWPGAGSCTAQEAAAAFVPPDDEPDDDEPDEPDDDEPDEPDDDEPDVDDVEAPVVDGVEDESLDDELDESAFLAASLLPGFSALTSPERESLR